MKYLLLIISLSFLSVGCESRYTFEQKGAIRYRYDGWTGDVHYQIRKEKSHTWSEWRESND